MIQVFRHHLPARIRKQHVVTTLGSFDGLHRGHQRILDIARTRTQANNGFLLMICFYPHPRETLEKGIKVQRILDLYSRLNLLSKLGIDGLFFLKFNQKLARTGASEFFETVIRQECGTREFVLGKDAHIGHRREGDLTWIKKACQDAGILLHVAETESEGSSKIASRDIRDLIAAGELEQVQRLFGWPFCISGKVMHGSKTGRQLGFPTANIRPRNIVFPRHGVYVAYVQTAGALYPAVVNVGVRPTFGASKPLLEAHLLDVSDIDLYRQRISVHFLTFLREEKRFEDRKELTAQIKKDVEMARKILNERGEFQIPPLFSV